VLDSNVLDSNVWSVKRVPDLQLGLGNCSSGGHLVQVTSKVSAVIAAERHTYRPAAVEAIMERICHIL